jgi:hypothetical protein
MHGIRKFVTCVLLGFGFFASPAASAACRPIDDADPFAISADNLTALGQMGMTRDDVLPALRSIALFETEGCWSAPTGNSDGQLLSVGAMQDNYGQGSLQVTLKTIRQRYGGPGAFFNKFLKDTAPVYGATLIFSAPCLQVPVAAACKTALLQLQSADGKTLDPVFESEVDALFNSPAVLQVQVDSFLFRLVGAKKWLGKLFAPGTPLSRRQIAWAVDFQVNNGKYFTDATTETDVAALRLRLANATPQRKREILAEIVNWYGAMCNSVYQDGCALDRCINVRAWRAALDANQISDEQLDLLGLTFLRTRVASGNSGRYQADTFQRKAVHMMGVGSVHGRIFGTVSPAPCKL